MTTQTDNGSHKGANAMLWAGLATLILGLVVAGLSMFRMIDSIRMGNPFTSPVVEAPVTLVEYYEPDTYFVYQASDGSQDITPDQVSVSGADGELPVTRPGYQATIDDGDLAMEAVAAFTVTSAGEYSVAIESDESTQVRVAPSLGTGVGSALSWGAGIGVGALLSLIGLILALVGIARRISGNKPAVTAGAPPGISAAPLPASPASAAPQPATPASPPIPTLPPPGWYPDPVAIGSQRYWDGSSWTEHHT